MTRQQSQLSPYRNRSVDLQCISIVWFLVMATVDLNELKKSCYEKFDTISIDTFTIFLKMGSADVSKNFAKFFRTGILQSTCERLLDIKKIVNSTLFEKCSGVIMRKLLYTEFRIRYSTKGPFHSQSAFIQTP